MIRHCLLSCSALFCFVVILHGLVPLMPVRGLTNPAPVALVVVPPSSSGIRWVHDNGMSPERYLPETVGPGCAFFDYDNDGYVDVYLVNSGPCDFFAPSKRLRNALYRNKGDGSFTDVTEESGTAGGVFGMGAAVADYDGDGWQDLYVTAYGRSLLYHNNGNGSFSEIGRAAGVAVEGWTTGAVWFDYDKDGKLDLFVSSFVQYSRDQSRFCGDNNLNRRHYCVPRAFKPTPSYLFRNEGDGKFRDVSRSTGIASVSGKAFGAVATDINNDGWLDLFVANDTVANFLFLNRQGQKFEEIGLTAGVAYSEAGSPRSGMGVDAADFDGDNWQDLFVANVDGEMFSLYRNRQNLEFEDEILEIRNATRQLSGWGLRFLDIDNDGDADLILANGHPDDMVEAYKSYVTYKEPLLLFENLAGKYVNVSARSGEVFANKYPARGLAVGDYDNDGDLDILIANNGEAPLLLRNEGNKNNWIGLALRPIKSNPEAVGAEIRWSAAGKEWRRLKTGGGSYLASHDRREILGVGSATKIDWIEVRWPSGAISRLSALSLGRYIEVRESDAPPPSLSNPKSAE